MCPVSSPRLGVHVKFFSVCSPPSVESEVRKREGECCPPRQKIEVLKVCAEERWQSSKAEAGLSIDSRFISLYK